MGLMTNISEAMERMRRMMATTGVDLSQLPGNEIAATMKSAGTTCCGCNAVGACEQFLEQAEPGADAPAFCPNTPRFAPFVQDS
jgi:hypothetical protein